MSELAAFLTPRFDTLIQRWTERVGHGVAPEGLSEPVLRDHVGDVLRALVASLERGLVPETIVSAKVHGKQRYRVGFRIDALVLEYGVLRSLLFDLAAEASLTRPFEELRVLSEFISVAITEGVAEYGQCQHDEQRHRERLLTDARLLSDSALTAGSVGTFTWDILADRVYGDASFALLFGIRLDATGAAPITEYLAAIHPDDRAATTAKIKSTLAEGGAYEAEYRIVAAGRERWVVARGRVDRDEAGKPVRFPGVLMDITDRKLAEDAQRALTARLATALAAGGLGTFEWDLRINSLQLDARAREIFAFRSGEEISAAAVFERIDSVDRARVQAETEAAMASKPRMSADYRVSIPGRPSVSIVSVGEFLRGADGKAERMIGVFRDVTEERQAAEQLRRSEEHVRRIVEASGAGLWDLHVESGRIDSDARMVELMGLPAGGSFTLATALEGLLAPEDRQRVGDALKDALSGKNEGRYQVEFRTGGNSTAPLRWVESRARVSFDTEGNAQQLSGAMIDITARKLAEAEREQARTRVGELLESLQTLIEQLRRSEERYRTLFESIDEGFCLIEVLYDEQDKPFDYRYLQVNDAFENRSGLHDAVGKTIREMVPTIEPFWPELFGRVVATGEPARVENPVTGVGRWFDVHASRVGPAEQRQVVVLFSDVTDRKKFELERERLLALETDARHMAEEASRLKDEFLATVSHELRTPLNAILGWVQMVRGGTMAAEKNSRALETIERNARSQARLIEDLLDMSRILSGKLALETQALDVAGVVEAAIESIRPAADAKGIRLQPVLDSGGVVMADPNRLQQVVWNLLTNAVKFTPKGGRVQVLMQCIDSAVELTVADTGQGIAVDFLPHVFERFRQAEGGMSRAKGGLGLGLSIVKQLVEMHGGTISVFSEGVGQGATFTVRLPLSVLRRRESDVSIDTRSTPLPKTTGRELEGLRLLVVEDEDDTREMLVAMLEINGASVVQASSAEEGRKAFAAQRPDLLVSDVGMPGENGYTFIASIRTLPNGEGSNVPAVALTAYARSEDRMRALTAGFSSHVAKPVESAELIAVIASLARHAR